MWIRIQWKTSQQKLKSPKIIIMSLTPILKGAVMFKDMDMMNEAAGAGGKGGGGGGGGQQPWQAQQPQQPW